MAWARAVAVIAASVLAVIARPQHCPELRQPPPRKVRGGGCGGRPFSEFKAACGAQYGQRVNRDPLIGSPCAGAAASQHSHGAMRYRPMCGRIGHELASRPLAASTRAGRGRQSARMSAPLLARYASRRAKNTSAASRAAHLDCARRGRAHEAVATFRHPAGNQDRRARRAPSARPATWHRRQALGRCEWR